MGNQLEQLEAEQSNYKDVDKIKSLPFLNQFIISSVDKATNSLPSRTMWKSNRRTCGKQF